MIGLVDLFETAARRRPDAIFLRWPDGTATYGAVMDAVADQAHRFERAGLAGGARVAIRSSNRPELIIAWLALQRVGSVAVFVNPALGREEMERVIDHLGVAASMGEAPFPDGIAGTFFPERPAAAAVAVPPSGGPRHRIGGDAILLTSGSTGDPKFVEVPSAAYVLKGTLNTVRLGHRPDDRFLAVMPLFHVGAQCETLAPAIVAGASIHLRPGFSATGFWDLVDEEGITVVHATHSLLLMAFARGAIRPPHAARLRTVVASLRADVVDMLAAAVPAASAVTVYGMTECPLATLGNRGDRYEPGYVGRPYGSRKEIRIVAADGSVCDDDDAVGEIQLRNAACATGYLPDGAGGTLRTDDGWLRTGDLGRWGRGGLYLSGRIRELVRRAGENIAPVEIEEVLGRHPDVVEAAVTSHPDDVRGEEVRVFIELVDRAGTTPAELRRHVLEHLARHKAPRYIDIVAALPRTGSNKPDKPRLLREHPVPGWDAEA